MLTMAKHLFMYVVSMGGAWRKHLQNKNGKKVPRERKQQVKVLWVILEQWGWNFVSEGESDGQSQPGSRLCVCGGGHMERAAQFTEVPGVSEIMDYSVNILNTGS